MNTSTKTTIPTETSLTRDWINLARYYVGRFLGGRRGLIIATLAAVVIGLALNWSWLVAIGVAPLLISLAPCAVMCALGLCMSGMGGKSCSTDTPSAGGDRDARSPSSAPDAETPGQPVAALTDRNADAFAKRIGDREARAASLPRGETTGERS